MFLCTIFVRARKCVRASLRSFLYKYMHFNNEKSINNVYVL